MEALTIHDVCDHGLAFDLIDLLRLYESEVLALSWICRGVWCLGDGATEFEQVSESGIVLDGEDLFRLASHVYQVIDGEFVGMARNRSEPRLVVVAEDSTYYVVMSPDSELLARIRKRFSDVRTSPEWAAQFAEHGSLTR